MPSDRKMMALDFPLRGLHTALSHRAQPRFTSPDLLNVRAYEPIEGRIRGGQRPGLARRYREVLGGGQPIRLLTQGTRILTSVATTQRQYFYYWQDDFARTGTSLGADYQDATWLGPSPPVTDTLGVYTTFRNPGAAYVANYSLETDGISAFCPLTVAVEILPNQGKHWGKYYLFVAFNPLAPDPQQDGIVIRFVPRSGSLAAEVRVIEYQAGAAINTWQAPVTVPPPPNPIRFSFDLYGQVEPPGWSFQAQGADCVVQGELTQQPTGLVGFGMDVNVSGLSNVYPPAICLVGRFEIAGVTEAITRGTTYRTFLLGSAGGTTYVEHTPGAMDALTGEDVGLSRDRPLFGTPRSYKVYVADYGTKAIGSDGLVAANGVDLTAPSISNWLLYDMDSAADLVIITDGTGDVVDGVYAISGVSGNVLTLATSVGGAGTCSYTIGRAPKVYDSLLDSLTLWRATPTKGIVPIGCPLIALYRDRLVLAGGETDPHIWYMSRQGDPDDWDYGQTDVQRAVAGEDAPAGRIGEPITALIPFSDDFLIFGCAGSIWVLRGDPAYQGMIDAVDREVGILSGGAWCQGATGEVYFLSAEGLFVMMPDGSAPKPLSRDLLPRELTSVDTAVYWVSLGWNPREQGVHIFLTKREGAADNKHWFYDVRDGGFFPDSTMYGHGPTAVHNYHTELEAYRHLLIGGADGRIRYFSPDADDDDGREIPSHVVYQPIRLTDDWNQGVLTEMVATTDNASGPIGYDILVGDCHQDILTASVFASGTWQTGLQHSTRSRARGGSFGLKLRNGDHQRWTVEKIMALVKRAGRHRKP